MRRKQEQYIKEDLKEKYVFLGGPRQSGKTTLAKSLNVKKHEYFNYDLSSDRQIMTSATWSRETDLVILDEFHKFPNWKTFLKGIYDTEANKPNVLVTGSAKLNIFKKGNDSMAGRYYYHRLLPLSVKELEGLMKPEEALEALLAFGSFPEPLLAQSKIKSSRWRESYLDRVVKEDVTDLSNIRNIRKIVLLVDMLRQRVGSPISYTSIARDLEVAPKTVKEWIELLEELFLVFRVTPYHRHIARSILKEPKIYFFDCSMAFDEKAHLENLVALSLLKDLWFQEDVEGSRCSLHYLRTKDGKEIDFLTVVNRKPADMVEVKSSDDSLSGAFVFFMKSVKPQRSYQIVKNLTRRKTVANVNITHVHKYLSSLKI